MGTHSLKALTGLAEGSIFPDRLMVWRVDDDMGWGVGCDPAPSPLSPESSGLDKLWEEYDTRARDTLPALVLDSLRRLQPNRYVGADCTEAFLAESLAPQNAPRPELREALPGGDLLTGFCMAQMLGPRFFEKPGGSWWHQLTAFKKFMKDNGLPVDIHDSCEILRRYPEIQRNALWWRDLPAFRTRYEPPIRPGQEDPDLRQELDERHKQLVGGRTYDGWEPAIARGTGSYRNVPIETHLSKQRIAGEVGASPQIYRLQVDGWAVDARSLANEGRRVLPVNDSRILWLARLVAKGQHGILDETMREENQKLAVMAGTQFVDAALGTLLRNVRTYVIMPEESVPSS